jgi:glycosyltransferase involved in cell wall biosynthesis
MGTKPKLAIVVSHPIQHFCPQYASFAQTGLVQLKVFFLSSLGMKKYMDPDFNEEITWTNLQLDQFDHVFLNQGRVVSVNKSLDAPELERELEAFDPELLIIYGYFQRFQRKTHRWAVKKKITLAYISDSERRQQRNQFKEMLKYWYLRNFFSGVDWFLSVGDANEEFYEYYDVKSSKLIRMHFPIDVSFYEKCFAEKGNLRRAFRSRFGIGENDIVLAVVGKMVSWKRQQDIIEALILLEGKGQHMHLFIIGSGEWMGVLKAHANKLKISKIHFPGFVKPEALPEFYAATDIYVHPAAVEPHSLAISEAIYMGCPIIISDRCGSYGKDDDVQEGNNGYVYSCGNISELAACIERLAAHPDIRRDFGKYSHRISVGFQQQSHTGSLKELVTRSNLHEAN